MSNSTKKPAPRKRAGTKAAQAAEVPTPMWKKLVLAATVVAVGYGTLWAVMSSSEAEAAESDQSDIPVVEDIATDEEPDGFIKKWIRKQVADREGELAEMADALDARERELDSREDAVADSESLADLKYFGVTAAATALQECSLTALKEVQSAAANSES